MRPRRLRRSDALRRMVREVHLTPDQLILPLFVTEAGRSVEPVPSLPGVNRYPIPYALKQVAAAERAGLGGVILFGVTDSKDPDGTSACDPNGPVATACREIKRTAPNLTIMTDVCLCGYTDHGHCGPLRGDEIANDAALPLLAEMAVVHAQAGADVVAPSAMMDGQVAAIRNGLDAAGCEGTAILSYTVKFASAYYGPFRDAAGSAPAFGDRRTYQMDPGSRREARREAEQDVREGADMLMVKPALAFLDILREVANESPVPVAAYNVSGEYAMVKAAAANGWLDERAIVLETLTGMRRAGADFILTYHALDAAAWLQA